MELCAFFIDDSRWSPGIGDPTPMGWITVLAYLAAAVLCARAGRAEQRSEEPARRVVLFWALLTAGMVALGINKQLDLQSLLTQIGRDLAQRDGWYEQRGGVQKLFILALGVLAVGSGAAMLLWLRRYLRELWLAILGGLAIASFVVVRASSFHKVDSLLGTYVGFVKMNWVLELGGIALVAWGAWRAPRARAWHRAPR
ncbi:MAG: hypothetical protein IPN34_15545 [Planctomycetes bacterium]|nr:hypothetical protein [Planctomycetota bacterium]